MAALKGAGLWLCLMTGCGDPLVEISYGDPPKLILRGSLDDAQPPLELPRDIVRGGIFWLPRGREKITSYSELVEQSSNGQSLPADFTWILFDEPGPEHLATTPSGARYGLGLPLAYVDANGDRRWEPAELLVADSPLHAVLFTPAPLSAEDSPTGRAVAAGHALIQRLRICSPQAVPAADEECGVPLGSPCNADADCHGGVCLMEEPWTWDGGYCAIPEPPPNGCRQRGAALFRSFSDLKKAWWVRACQSPSDCERGFPYQCELTQGACLPTARVSLLASRKVEPRPFCAEELSSPSP
jgi:hypothetical protein